MSNVSGLYIHIPFCRSRCSYCDFFSGTDFSCANSYVSNVCRDVKRFEPLLDKLETIYIGGGTPSALGSELSPLLKALSRFSVKEFTVEANPDSLTYELLQTYLSYGVNRISIGVQSLQQIELDALKRRALVPKTVHVLELLRDSGVTYSVDSMVGIPYQTPQSLFDTLHKVFYFAPSHISVYPLQLEKKTLLYKEATKGSISLPTEDETVDLMLFANETLKNAGYRHYEVANYAQPGKEAIHNSNYWRQKSYLGLGKSAASMLFPKDFKTYSKIQNKKIALQEDTARVRFSNVEPFSLDELTFKAAAAEKLILASRMTHGLKDAVIKEASSVLGVKPVQDTLEKLCALGFLTKTAWGYTLTQQGWLMGNEMYLRFLHLL